MAVASKMGQGGKGSSGKKSCPKCEQEYSFVVVHPGKKTIRICNCGRFDKSGNSA
jgi:hypothetical protein